ncbi:MAG TPA: beta-galactosidase [Abditibacteriaceae bacterium]|jgi:beta-galactosidase
MTSFSGYGRLLHGGDYNPEQWLETPEVWDEDMRLLQLSNCNTVSLGIFAWASLEPSEGVYSFGWMDEIFERLARNGQSIILATPSGGKPNWMGLKYPEIRRTQMSGQKEHQAGRHNHCATSPVYRAKVREINTLLAERYGSHPSLLMWHVSNEYGGYCSCELCFAAFRKWLQKRYGTLEKMNAAWWSRFWSHTFGDWEEITYIDSTVHGLQLDWRRFMTEQGRTFLENEIEPLKEHSPHVPTTTNMMGNYPDNNYWQWADSIDVISWNVYPDWHHFDTEIDVAQSTAWNHDLYRSMKGGQPFYLMETTPSQTNWQQVPTPKRPGIHRLMCLQAIAHGSESALYFQFRKSRGSIEKFHGAIVGHDGTSDTRVFREVAEVGSDFKKLQEVSGSRIAAEVALIYDWENEWAITGAQGPRNRDRNYRQTVEELHRPFWRRGISADVIDSTVDFSGYKILIAPMLYMLRPGVAERITAFVENGGTFVATYLTGIADESDLCFLGGFPGPLREVMGLWIEETDVLQDHHEQSVLFSDGSTPLGGRSYKARHYCDIVRLESAKVLAIYGEQFYAGTPALTENQFGKGRAFYIASRNDANFHEDFVGGLIDSCVLKRALETEIPEGVSVQMRADENHEWIFILNFSNSAQQMTLPDAEYLDVLEGRTASSTLHLPIFGASVLRRARAGDTAKISSHK